MPGQPTQPELKADLAALPRRVPLVPERSDFIESMPRLRSGSRHSSPRRCCHRPRCSDHHTLRASVRHTDAFPNSARLVRVSCLECVFRVQRRRSRATESRQMVTIDRWFLSVCYPKPNSAGVRIAQRTRFCLDPNLITICEAIPPPSISKVAQKSPNPDRLS